MGKGKTRKIERISSIYNWPACDSSEWKSGSCVHAKIDLMTKRLQSEGAESESINVASSKKSRPRESRAFSFTAELRLAHSKHTKPSRDKLSQRRGACELLTNDVASFP